MNCDLNASQTASILEILRHATDWPKCYRKHYVAGPDHSSWGALLEACDAGLMFRTRRSWVPDDIFIVTDLGIQFLRSKEKATT